MKPSSVVADWIHPGAGPPPTTARMMKAPPTSFLPDLGIMSAAADLKNSSVAALKGAGGGGGGIGGAVQSAGAAADFMARNETMLEGTPMAGMASAGLRKYQALLSSVRSKACSDQDQLMADPLIRSIFLQSDIDPNHPTGLCGPAPLHVDHNMALMLSVPREAKKILVARAKAGELENGGGLGELLSGPNSPIAGVLDDVGGTTEEGTTETDGGTTDGGADGGAASAPTTAETSTAATSSALEVGRARAGGAAGLKVDVPSPSSGSSTSAAPAARGGKTTFADDADNPAVAGAPAEGDGGGAAGVEVDDGGTTTTSTTASAGDTTADIDDPTEEVTNDDGGEDFPDDQNNSEGTTSASTSTSLLPSAPSSEMVEMLKRSAAEKEAASLAPTDKQTEIMQKHKEDTMTGPGDMIASEQPLKLDEPPSIEEEYEKLVPAYAKAQLLDDVVKIRNAVSKYKLAGGKGASRTAILAELVKESENFAALYKPANFNGYYDDLRDNYAEEALPSSVAEAELSAASGAGGAVTKYAKKVPGFGAVAGLSGSALGQVAVAAESQSPEFGGFMKKTFNVDGDTLATHNDELVGALGGGPDGDGQPSMEKLEGFVHNLQAEGHTDVRMPSTTELVTNAGESFGFPPDATEAAADQLEVAADLNPEDTAAALSDPSALVADPASAAESLGLPQTVTGPISQVSSVASGGVDPAAMAKSAGVDPMAMAGGAFLELAREGVLPGWSAGAGGKVVRGNNRHWNSAHAWYEEIMAKKATPSSSSSSPSRHFLQHGSDFSQRQEELFHDTRATMRRIHSQRPRRRGATGGHLRPGHHRLRAGAKMVPGMKLQQLARDQSAAALVVSPTSSQNQIGKRHSAQGRTESSKTKSKSNSSAASTAFQVSPENGEQDEADAVNDAVQQTTSAAAAAHEDIQKLEEAAEAAAHDEAAALAQLDAFGALMKETPADGVPAFLAKVKVTNYPVPEQCTIPGKDTSVEFPPADLEALRRYVGKHNESLTRGYRPLFVRCRKPPVAGDGNTVQEGERRFPESWTAKYNSVSDAVWLTREERAAKAQAAAAAEKEAETAQRKRMLGESEEDLLLEGEHDLLEPVGENGEIVDNYGKLAKEVKECDDGGMMPDDPLSQKTAVEALAIGKHSEGQREKCRELYAKFEYATKLRATMPSNPALDGPAGFLTELEREQFNSLVTPARWVKAPLSASPTPAGAGGSSQPVDAASAPDVDEALDLYSSNSLPDEFVRVKAVEEDMKKLPAACATTDAAGFDFEFWIAKPQGRSIDYPIYKKNLKADFDEDLDYAMKETKNYRKQVGQLEADMQTDLRAFETQKKTEVAASTLAKLEAEYKKQVGLLDGTNAVQKTGPLCTEEFADYEPAAAPGETETGEEQAATEEDVEAESIQLKCTFPDRPIPLPGERCAFAPECTKEDEPGCCGPRDLVGANSAYAAKQQLQALVDDEGVGFDDLVAQLRRLQEEHADYAQQDADAAQVMDAAIVAVEAKRQTLRGALDARIEQEILGDNDKPIDATMQYKEATYSSFHAKFREAFHEAQLEARKKLWEVEEAKFQVVGKEPQVAEGEEPPRVRKGKTTYFRKKNKMGKWKTFKIEKTTSGTGAAQASGGADEEEDEPVEITAEEQAALDATKKKEKFINLRKIHHLDVRNSQCRPGKYFLHCVEKEAGSDVRGTGLDDYRCKFIWRAELDPEKKRDYSYPKAPGEICADHVTEETCPGQTCEWDAESQKCGTRCERLFGARQPLCTERRGCKWREDDTKHRAGSVHTLDSAIAHGQDSTATDEQSYFVQTSTERGGKVDAGNKAPTSTPPRRGLTLINGSFVDGETPAGAGSDGETPAGAGSDGETPAGAGSDGETPAGAGSDGETPAGAGSDGETPAGAGSDGEGTSPPAPAAAAPTSGKCVNTCERFPTPAACSSDFCTWDEQQNVCRDACSTFTEKEKCGNTLATNHCFWAAGGTESDPTVLQDQAHGDDEAHCVDRKACVTPRQPSYCRETCGCWAKRPAGETMWLQTCGSLIQEEMARTKEKHLTTQALAEWVTKFGADVGVPAKKVKEAASFVMPSEWEIKVFAAKKVQAMYPNCSCADRSAELVDGYAFSHYGWFEGGLLFDRVRLETDCAAHCDTDTGDPNLSCAGFTFDPESKMCWLYKGPLDPLGANRPHELSETGATLWPIPPEGAEEGAAGEAGVGGEAVEGAGTTAEEAGAAGGGTQEGAETVDQTAEQAGGTTDLLEIGRNEARPAAAAATAATAFQNADANAAPQTAGEQEAGAGATDAATDATPVPADADSQQTADAGVDADFADKVEEANANRDRLSEERDALMQLRTHLKISPRTCDVVHENDTTQNGVGGGLCRCPGSGQFHWVGDANSYCGAWPAKAENWSEFRENPEDEHPLVETCVNGEVDAESCHVLAPSDHKRKWSGRGVVCTQPKKFEWVKIVDNGEVVGNPELAEDVGLQGKRPAILRRECSTCAGPYQELYVRVHDPSDDAPQLFAGLWKGIIRDHSSGVKHGKDAKADAKLPQDALAYLPAKGPNLNGKAMLDDLEKNDEGGESTAAKVRKAMSGNLKVWTVSIFSKFEDALMCEGSGGQVREFPADRRPCRGAWKFTGKDGKLVDGKTPFPWGAYPTKEEEETASSLKEQIDALPKTVPAAAEGDGEGEGDGTTSDLEIGRSAVVSPAATPAVPATAFQDDDAAAAAEAGDDAQAGDGAAGGAAADETPPSDPVEVKAAIETERRRMGAPLPSGQEPAAELFTEENEAEASALLPEVTWSVYAGPPAHQSDLAPLDDTCEIFYHEGLQRWHVARSWNTDKALYVGMSAAESGEERGAELAPLLFPEGDGQWTVKPPKAVEPAGELGAAAVGGEAGSEGADASTAGAAAAGDDAGADDENLDLFADDQPSGGADQDSINMLQVGKEFLPPAHKTEFLTTANGKNGGASTTTQQRGLYKDVGAWFLHPAQHSGQQLQPQHLREQLQRHRRAKNSATQFAFDAVAEGMQGASSSVSQGFASAADEWKKSGHTDDGGFLDSVKDAAGPLGDGLGSMKENVKGKLAAAARYVLGDELLAQLSLALGKDGYALMGPDEGERLDNTWRRTRGGERLPPMEDRAAEEPTVRVVLKREKEWGGGDLGANDDPELTAAAQQQLEEDAREAMAAKNDDTGVGDDGETPDSGAGPTTTGPGEDGEPIPVVTDPELLNPSPEQVAINLRIAKLKVLATRQAEQLRKNRISIARMHTPGTTAPGAAAREEDSSQQAPEEVLTKERYEKCATALVTAIATQENEQKAAIMLAMGEPDAAKKWLDRDPSITTRVMDSFSSKKNSAMEKVNGGTAAVKKFLGYGDEEEDESGAASGEGEEGAKEAGDAYSEYTQDKEEKLKDDLDKLDVEEVEEK